MLSYMVLMMIQNIYKKTNIPMTRGSLIILSFFHCSVFVLCLYRYFVYFA
jgi:hypothetical protein